ncbi:MAG: D-alanyl-D-alanine carboxypeptidase [Saprospiraceae bacterium]
MWRVSFISLLLLLFQVSGSTQSPLDEATDRFLKHPLSSGATISMSVRDARNGDLVYQHQGDTWMIPASNQKLVTTAAAWSLLGPDHRIPTIIHWKGIILDSVFVGEMVLEGHGDPSLASGRFGPSASSAALVQRWVMQLRQLGIREIRGQVTCAPETFPGSPIGLTWEWSDLGSCYAQGIWPVNWEENCLQAELNRDSAGFYLSTDSLRLPWPVIASLEPGRAPSEPDFLTGPAGEPTRWIGGPEEIRFPLAIRMSVPDVPSWLQEQIPRLFDNQGMPWHIHQIAMAHQRLVWRDTIWSPPLKVLIREANSESNNLVAEALVRRMGEVLGGTSSVGQGLVQIRKWIGRHDLSPSPYLHDGSGLSRQNALTANFLTGLLAAIASDSLVIEGYPTTLAEGGKSGTLRRFLKDKRLAGKIRAKTGTLNRVRCLSGYLDTPGGRTLSFSILSNQFTGSTREFMALCQQWLLDLSNSAP